MGRRHEIKLIHEFGPSEFYQFKKNADVEVRSCRHCKSRQHILRTSKAKGPTIAELSRRTPTPPERRYFVETFKEFTNTLSDFLKRIHELEDECFGETEFDGIIDFADYLKKRYPHSIDDDDITYEIARHYLDASNATPKMIKRKILLVLKQGFVCNRCDSVFRSLPEFEADHVVPKAKGGQSVLENLQLLCTECHRKKADNDPLPGLDCSPFDDTFAAPICIHELQCSILYRYQDPDLKQSNILRNGKLTLE